MGKSLCAGRLLQFKYPSSWWRSY